MGKTQRSRTVEELVEHFERAVPGEVDPEDLGNLHLLLTVHRDVTGSAPDHWRAGDIAALLLDDFPRKVTPDASLLRDGPEVLGRFLGVLASSGALRGAPVRALRAELAETAPLFAAAMRDGSRFGMAKTLVAAMAADGVQPDDAAAVQRWTADFNARPFEERKALTDHAFPVADAPVEPIGPLLAVDLAPQDELLEAARAAPLATRVRALLAHVGPKGLTVTGTGALRLADARALAAACGDEGRLLRPEPWQGPVRRMADLPGVEEAYELAVLAGLLELSATRVRRDDDAPGTSDDLALVCVLADAAVEIGVFVGDVHAFVQDLVDAVSEELPSVLVSLYAAREPVAVEELAGRLAEQFGLAADDSPGSGHSTVRVYLERVFARFERLGVVERLGLHVPPERAFLGPEAEQTTSVTLSPLGVWWLQRVLTDWGVDAPVRGALVEVSAAALCDGLAGLSLEDGQEEARAWVAARESSAAAEQLAALLADSEVVRRQFALSVLDDLPEAEAAVRRRLDDPAARPYARLWLESGGHGVPERYQDESDRPLLLVETASLLVDAGAVDELVGQLSALGPPEQQVDLVRQLWRVPSPATERVLTAIAMAAPGPVGKAARKALHSLRSARG